MVREKYNLDFADYEHFEKTLGRIGKEAGLTTGQIEQMGKDFKETGKKGEQSFAGVEKKMFNVNQIAGTLGKTFVAAFAVDQLVTHGAKLVELEKKYTGIRNTVKRFGVENTATVNKLTASVSALNKVFDADINETLRASNALSKQMGVSFEEAFDLIEKGFVQGADLGGDFLNKLEEYPVQFEKAGFSADQFIAIATQEARGGIFGDKLLDSVKEIGLRLREMTPAAKTALAALGDDFAVDFMDNLATGTISTVEAIGLLETRIEKVNPDIAQMQTLVADLGGGPLEDLGGFPVLFENLNAALDGSNDKMDALAEKNLKLLNSERELERELVKLTSVFEGAGTSIEIVFNKALTGAVEGVNNLILAMGSASMRAAVLADDVREQFSDLGEKELGRQVKTYEEWVANLKEIQKETEDDNLFEGFLQWVGGENVDDRLAQAKSGLNILKELQAERKAEEAASKSAEEAAKKEAEERQKRIDALKAERAASRETYREREEMGEQLTQKETEWLEAREELGLSEVEIRENMAKSLGEIDEKMLEANIERFRKEEEILQAYADARIEAEQQVIAAAAEGVSALAGLAEQGSGLQMFLLATAKALAVAEILINLQKEIAAIGAWSAAFGPAAPGIAAPYITAAKTRAGIGVGLVLAQGISEVAGFYEGGYTGDMDERKTAGVVHGKEFVSTAKTTKKHRGALEAMHEDRMMTPLEVISLLPHIPKEAMIMTPVTSSEVSRNGLTDDSRIVDRLDKIAKKPSFSITADAKAFWLVQQMENARQKRLNKRFKLIY